VAKRKQRNPVAEQMVRENGRYRQRVVQMQREMDWKKELDNYFKEGYNEE
jgi:hypothetical protein